MGLVHNDCQGKCDWHATSASYEGQPLFRCTGCQSEWTSAERWTPRNADGEVSAEVLAARGSMLS